jgi:quercetin dioxygenase-like cupin family protein
MARIYLKPQEHFEHLHKVESESMLIEGLVKFRIENSTKILNKGEAIRVPANKLHCMENIGDVVAIIDCEHTRFDG